MSDRLNELQRVLLILNSLTQWEELGNKLGLSPADLDFVKVQLAKESGLSSAFYTVVAHDTNHYY